MKNMDWIFDTSRESTFPRGEGGSWRFILKYWVLWTILVCLGAVAAVVTLLLRPKDMSVEFFFALVMGGMILVFCVFLVWMTYRRHLRRRDYRRETEDIALNREIAKYYREKRIDSPTDGNVIEE